MVVTVTRPRAQGYGAQLADDWFRLAASPSFPQHTHTRDSLAPRQDQEGSAGNSVLALGYAFGRGNLTGGEGLDWWPRVTGEVGSDLDRIRFWDSNNMDIRRPKSGQPYLISLSKEMPTFRTPASTPVDMGASRDAVYLAYGSDIDRHDDWADATADANFDIGENVVNIDVGNDDTVVVVGTSGDIWIKPSRSDVYVKVYDTPTNGTAAKAAWWVKGRIIAACIDTANATNGIMREIDPGIGGTTAAPTVTPVFNTVDTYSGDMNAVVDAGHALIACFSDGSLRSYVPQTDTQGGIPELTIRARTQVPAGENPYALAWSMGVFLIFTLAEASTVGATISRLYTATVLDERFDYSIGNLQLIRVWEGSAHTAPAYTQNIVTTRDEAFFVMGEGTDDWNIWRFDMVTQGLFRHMGVSETAGHGLVMADRRLGMLVGTTVKLESATVYTAQGYLIYPNITFGLNTPINWTNFVVEVLGLEADGARVDLFRSTDPEAILDSDHASWVLVDAYTDPVQSGVEKAVVNLTANQLSIMLKVYRSTDTLSAPAIQRAAVRGLPQHRDWLVEIPVNISDYVSAPNRAPLRIPGHGDTVHSRLVGLQGANTTLTLLDPPLTLRGIVEGLSEPVFFFSDRGSQGRQCVVTFLGKLVGTDPNANVQGNEGLGVATLGIGTLGIGEVE